MKKMILAATAALAMLASCNKHTDEIADSATGSVVKITLTDKTPETRAFFDQTAAAESWEKKIGTLTLFVFDGNGDAVLCNASSPLRRFRDRRRPFPYRTPHRGKRTVSMPSPTAVPFPGSAHWTTCEARPRARSRTITVRRRGDDEGQTPAGFTMTGSATQAIAAAGQTTTVQIAL
ncbi:hypothetical protein [Alistipes putredinis]|uniref:hypothetical protein n=1 Tax=Alistipes putredinis TaxID=28117 RepID=UPI00399245C5